MDQLRSKYFFFLGYLKLRSFEKEMTTVRNRKKGPSLHGAWAPQMVPDASMVHSDYIPGKLNSDFALPVSFLFPPLPSLPLSLPSFLCWNKVLFQCKRLKASLFSERQQHRVTLAAVVCASPCGHLAAQPYQRCIICTSNGKEKIILSFYL